MGERGLKWLGAKKWRHEVAAVIEIFRAALEPDYIVLGGGNAKRLKELPDGVRLGDNTNAFVGGFRLWENRGGLERVADLAPPAAAEDPSSSAPTLSI